MQALPTQCCTARRLATASLSAVLSGWSAILCALVLLFAVSACDPGDGGGIGGTGITPDQPMPVGFSVGPITGFGSILLNEQRFETDAADILVNGESTTVSDLRIGMSVVAAVDFSEMTASRIDYYSTVIAPVEQIDVSARSFSLLQQSVIVNTGTTFENTSLEQLAVGDVLEVSGIRNERGAVVATYVRPALQTDRVQLSGVILSEIDSERRVTISGLQVDLSGADLAQAIQPDLSRGSHVLITAPLSGYDPLAPLLNADSLKGSIDPAFSNGDAVEYEGIVSTFDSLSSFTLNWQASSASGSTIIVNQDESPAPASSIGRGSRIEIEGSVNDQGVLVARKIIVIATDDGEVQGLVEALDSSAETITVLGVELLTDGRTRYRDNGSFAALRVGDYVEVDTLIIGNQLMASRVEVEDVDSRALLKAPVTGFNAQTGELTVAGVAIRTGAQTEFEDGDDNEVSAEVFFASLSVGDMVRVRWDEYQSTALPPDEISAER